MLFDYETDSFHQMQLPASDEKNNKYYFENFIESITTPLTVYASV